MSACNMTFCRTCGLWIAETTSWANAEPAYCEKCKPASILKRAVTRIGNLIRAVFIGIVKKQQ